MFDDIVFGRRYSFITGRFERLAPKIDEKLYENTVEQIKYAVPSSLAKTTNYLDYTTIPAEFIEINDLELSATISNSKENSTPATFEFKNIKKEYLNKIKDKDLVIFRAGYKQDISQINTSVGVGYAEDLPELFVGQIIKVSTVTKGQDRVTTIICGDSVTVKKASKITASWPPGTKRKQVIQDFAKMMANQGVPTGSIDFNMLLLDSKSLRTLNSSLVSSLVVQGYLFDEMATLLGGWGLNVYTSGGKLYIEPKKAIRTTEYTAITPYHIKGGIDLEADSTTSSSNGSSTDNAGLRLSLFLNGRIQPHLGVTITGTEDFDGDYKITGIEHQIESRGSKYDTILNLVKV